MNQKYMRKRSLAIIVVVLLVVVTVPIATFFASLWYIEHQRFQDADRAFRPLLSLEPLILSQPIAFHRHCRYIVEFPSDSKLSDATVAELAHLNNLPGENWLELNIETPKVTDGAITHLMSLRTLKVLNVRGRKTGQVRFW